MKRCGKKTEVYSRVVGYFRPVQNWNAGKKEEFKQRLVYRVEGGRLDGDHAASKSTAARSDALACS